MEDMDMEQNRLKKTYKTLEEFMSDFPELTEEDAKEIFPLLDKLREGERMLRVLHVKLRVLEVVKHVLIICMILMVPCLLFQETPINFWLWVGASVTTVLTGIFTLLFMQFYGRRKK